MKSTVSRSTKGLFWLFLVNSILFSVVYFCVASFGFPITFVYLLLLLGVTLYYVIYNRGFVYKNATPEMLPDTMTLPEKEALLATYERRLSSSRWALTLIFPIVLALALDIMYLYLLPLLEGIFS